MQFNPRRARAGAPYLTLSRVRLLRPRFLEELDSRSSFDSGPTHRRAKLRTAEEFLRLRHRLEAVEHQDVARLALCLVHALGGDAAGLLQRRDLFVDLPPCVVVPNAVEYHGHRHFLRPLYVRRIGAGTLALGEAPPSPRWEQRAGAARAADETVEGPDAKLADTLRA